MDNKFIDDQIIYQELECHWFYQNPNSKKHQHQRQQHHFDAVLDNQLFFYTLYSKKVFAAMLL